MRTSPRLNKLIKAVLRDSMVMRGRKEGRGASVKSWRGSGRHEAKIKRLVRVAPRYAIMCLGLRGISPDVILWYTYAMNV